MPNAGAMADLSAGETVLRVVPVGVHGEDAPERRPMPDGERHVAGEAAVLPGERADEQVGEAVRLVAERPAGTLKRLSNTGASPRFRKSLPAQLGVILVARLRRSP